MAGIFQNGIWCCGFDMGLGGGFNNNNVNSSTPYGHGYSLTGYQFSLPFNTNLTSVIMGVMFNSVNTLNGQYVMNPYDFTANNSQGILLANANGSLSYYRGTTLLGTSALGVITAGNWYYIEMSLTVATGTGGAIVVNVNGSNVLNLTSVNTQNTANAYVNGLALAMNSGSVLYDDVYILDTTGSTPYNAMLGPVQVRGDFANATSAVTGGRNSFTPVGGAGHTTNISNIDTTPNSSYYNYSSTVGQFDQFAFPSLPSNVTSVLAVSAWVDVMLDASGTRTVSINQCAVSGGTPTDNLQAAFQPTVGALPYSDAQIVDPHGAAWTATTASAVEIGVKVVS